jgi:hypothetical protein
MKSNSVRSILANQVPNGGRIPVWRDFVRRDAERISPRRRSCASLVRRTELQVRCLMSAPTERGRRRLKQRGLGCLLAESSSLLSTKTGDFAGDARSSQACHQLSGATLKGHWQPGLNNPHPLESSRRDEVVQLVSVGKAPRSASKAVSYGVAHHRRDRPCQCRYRRAAIDSRPHRHAEPSPRLEHSAHFAESRQSAEKNCSPCWQPTTS